MSVPASSPWPEFIDVCAVDDSLGICAELEAEMAHVIDTYECEWKAALADPEKLRQFRPFVNSQQPDPSVVFIADRAQHRPAYPHEKRELLETLTAGLRTPVREAAE